MQQPGGLSRCLTQCCGGARNCHLRSCAALLAGPCLVAAGALHAMLHGATAVVYGSLRLTDWLLGPRAAEDWDMLMLGHYCHDCPLVPAAPRYRAARAFFGTHGAPRRGCPLPLPFLPVMERPCACTSVHSAGRQPAWRARLPQLARPPPGHPTSPTCQPHPPARRRPTCPPRLPASPCPSSRRLRGAPAGAAEDLWLPAPVPHREAD